MAVDRTGLPSCGCSGLTPPSLSPPAQAEADYRSGVERAKLRLRQLQGEVAGEPLTSASKPRNQYDKAVAMLQVGGRGSASAKSTSSCDEGQALHDNAPGGGTSHLCKGICRCLLMVSLRWLAAWTHLKVPPFQHSSYEVHCGPILSYPAFAHEVPCLTLPLPGPTTVLPAARDASGGGGAGARAVPGGSRSSRGGGGSRAGGPPARVGRAPQRVPGAQEGGRQVGRGQGAGWTTGAANGAAKDGRTVGVVLVPAAAEEGGNGYGWEGSST